jgi:hypothetical protein
MSIAVSSILFSFLFNPTKKNCYDTPNRTHTAHKSETTQTSNKMTMDGGAKLNKNDPAPLRLSATSCDTHTGSSKLRFPFRLHDMLLDATKNGFEDVIGWLPSGTAFQIIDQDLFEEYILQAYFDMTKYKSFQRQLNLYRFQLIRRSTDISQSKNLVVGNTSTSTTRVQYRTTM